MKHSYLSFATCTLALTAGLLFGCGAQTSGSATSSTATEPATSSQSVAQSSSVAPQPSSNPAFDAESIAVALSRPGQNSILMLDDSTKALVRHLEAGKLPTRCQVLYDQMGALPSVEVTDQETIAEIVGLVGQVSVAGPSNVGITDNYHGVWFEYDDGTKTSFNFEGVGNLVRPDGNLFVEGDGPLWLRVRELQGSQDKYEQAHAVAVLAGKDMVASCPEAAREGDVVRITTNEVLDVMLKVCVSGAEVRQVDGMTYEFQMPDHQVAVYVTTENYPDGGGA